MRSIKIKIKIIIFFLILPFRAYAAFQDTGSQSARAKGMGNSGIAVLDDASSPAYNPAGLSRTENYQFLFTYAKPYTGVELVDFNYSCFSFLIPLKKAGACCVGWNGFRATGLYDEYSVVFSYGVSLGNILSAGWEKVSAGVNIKYLFHGFQLDSRTADDPVFLSGRNKGGVGLDAGLLFIKLIRSLPDFSFGLAVENINEPDVGLLDADPVYRQYGIGLSYGFSGKKKNSPCFKPGLDITLRNGDASFFAGIEAAFLNRLLIARAGANRSEVAAGLGSSVKMAKLFWLDLNYAFSFPTALRGSYGSHQFSLLARF